MRRGGYAFFASRRCDIFTADLCNSIMPKTSRMLSESKLFPHKMLRALGVSPSVYVTIPRETWDP